MGFHRMMGIFHRAPEAVWPFAVSVDHWIVDIRRLMARLLPSQPRIKKYGYEKQEIGKFLPLNDTTIKRQITSSSMFTL